MAFDETTVWDQESLAETECHLRSMMVRLQELLELPVLTETAFADIAAFSICDDAFLKQELLETLDVHRRLQLLRRRVRADIEELKLRRKLQGRLPDDRIDHN